METETDGLTVKQFCQREGIRISSVQVESNPNMEDSRQMDHWKVTLRNKAGKQMSLVFSKGIGHQGKEPGREEVLDCLASDATVKGQTFEDFCSEFGYDTDSRKAERTWKACIKQAEKLEKFLGRDLVEELMYECERL